MGPNRSMPPQIHLAEHQLEVLKALTDSQEPEDLTRGVEAVAELGGCARGQVVEQKEKWAAGEVVEAEWYFPAVGGTLTVSLDSEKH